MISIVIPAFNEEYYLPKLLDSIKRQTYKNYEIIVADADSKDKTRQIAKKHGCSIVKGGMPAAGRNSGAKSAKGDILLFLDADVQFDENFLKNAADEFEGRKLDVAGFYIHPLGNNIIDKIFFGIFNLWIFATQFFYPNASGSGIICKKCFVSENKAQKINSDIVKILRLILRKEWQIINRLKVEPSSQNLLSQISDNYYLYMLQSHAFS